MNHEALVNLLNSSKYSSRRSGKEELEKILKKDVYYCVIDNQHWWDILWNVLQWESKELVHSSKRGQQSSSYMNVRLLLFPDRFSCALNSFYCLGNIC